MPRASEPRVMVRMSAEGFAAVRAAAESAGVSVGGLVRECAERYAVELAREVSAGRVKLRRRSSGPSSAAAALPGRVGRGVDQRVPEVRGIGDPARRVDGPDRADVFRRVTQRERS